MNNKCKVTFLLAAAELLPGPKGQGKPDSLWVNVEDQRSWAWLIRVVWRDPSSLIVKQVPAGMPQGKVLQTWAGGSRWSPSWKLLKKNYSWHPIRLVRKTLFTEDLQWCFAVGERDQAQLWLQAQLQGGVSGWKMTGGDIRAGGCLLDQLNRTLLEASQTDQIPSVGRTFVQLTGFLLKPDRAGRGQSPRLEHGQKEESGEPIQIWPKRESLSESDEYLLFEWEPLATLSPWPQACHCLGRNLHSNSWQDFLCFALTEELGPKFWMNHSSSLSKSGRRSQV